jgi:uncharacterized protein (TIGR02118 family)
MLKIAFFLKRRPELTRPDFFAWWLDEHRSLVEKLPGLRRYVISLEAAGEDGSLDGLAELWFDDLAAAEAAFASAEGKAARADTEAHAIRRERIDLVEHPFVDRGTEPAFRLVSALKRRADMDRAQFKDWWLTRHAPMVVEFPELERYQVSLVEDGEEGFADGIAEVSFADLEALGRITSSPQVKAVQQDSVAHTSAIERLLVEVHVVF